MLDVDLKHKIDHLPIDQRVALLEYLARSVRDEIVHRPPRRRKSSLESLQGILRQPGKPAPGDEEIRAMVTDHLVEKFQ